MTRTITIDPVTRIEGHARVWIDLDDHGRLTGAGLVVNELRGFERILIGMEADHVPLVTSRICGVCPSAHHLAASKALEAAAGVEPPPAACALRELLYLGHFIHSHALSLFVLTGPDLLLGLDADPELRNVVGVVQAAPEAAKKALRLRTLGQKINELIGGRGIHPVNSVVGGVTFVLDAERRRHLTAWVDEANLLVGELVPLARELLLRQVEEHPQLRQDWVLPTWSLGTVREGKINFYDGILRLVDAEGVQQTEFTAAEYEAHLVESVLDSSYMKLVHIRRGEERHRHRVGPLARINAAEGFETPLADAGLGELRALLGRPCHLTVMQIYARALELLYSCEKARVLLSDPALDGETRVAVKFRGGRGIAHVEAPRGTLIHDYVVDERGIIQAANLLVATQHNCDAINHSIAQAAVSHVVGKADDRQLLNAVEFAIRCYDPCLSCATHAIGRMPLEIGIRRDGEVVRRILQPGAGR